MHTTIGLDLGVNTLIAASDGNKAVLVSGRAVKSTIASRNRGICCCEYGVVVPRDVSPAESHALLSINLKGYINSQKA